MWKLRRGRPRGSTKKNGKTYRLPSSRCTKKEYNMILFLAGEYAGGNLSKWLVHGALEAPRVRLVKT